MSGKVHYARSSILLVDGTKYLNPGRQTNDLDCLGSSDIILILLDSKY